jgi:HK97 family phage prohead protease
MEKLLATLTKSGDAFTFVASTASVDRMGDTVEQDFDLAEYLRNPVVLFGHDHDQPVGKALDVRFENGQLVADIEFAPTERGQEIKALVDHGTLRALSIGFTPGDTQVKSDGGLSFAKNSLLEISIVPVPANPDALRIKSTQEAPIMSDTQVIVPELKSVSQAAPEGLMSQISKALPALQSGQSFRTEVKSLSGLNGSGTTQIGLPPQHIGMVDMTTRLPSRLIDLISRVGTTNPSVHYVQIALSQNNAAQVPELGLKPESQLSAVSKMLDIPTWAHWASASKQVLADVAGLQSLIGSSLVEGLTRIVDAHVYEVLSTNATAFLPTSDMNDTVAELHLRIQQAGGSNAVVALNPSDYFSLMTNKTAGSGEYLGLSQIPGQTVIACPSIPVGKILGFDRSAAVLFERESTSVFVGYHGQQFITNEITVLVEGRCAAGVLNPNLVMIGDLPAARLPTTVTTGEQPPANPVDNQLWFNSANASMAIWYDNTWVQISSGAAAAK